MVLKHHVILLYPGWQCGVAWPVKGDAGYANYMNTLREHRLVPTRYSVMLTNIYHFPSSLQWQLCMYVNFDLPHRFVDSDWRDSKHHKAQQK